MKHRKEEDDLYRKFARQREEEESKFKEEFRVCPSYILLHYTSTSFPITRVVEVSMDNRFKYLITPTASDV